MSNYNEIDFGSNPTLTCDFDIDDVLTDPTAVSLQVEDPAGTISSYSYPATISKSATGQYFKTIACGIAGEWEHEWTGTGAVEAVKTKRFIIKRQGV